MQHQLSKNGPTVVGIGASAGGLAALKKFFEGIPADTGLVFVVVVHLSPDHESHLPDLLQPYVSFPVQQVADSAPLSANNVYIIPPNANISAIDTHLRVSKLEEHRRERAPIDHFFRTLAKTHDGNAIAVILTGTGSDGTLGIKEVKSKGGVVIVQDPNEAEFNGMPQSAIATGVVDRVLPIAEIPDAILRIDRTEPQFPEAEDGHESKKDPQGQLLQKLLAQLRVRTDRDFSRYKQSTLLRRVARRMQLNYIEDPQTYLQKLRDHPEEARALADDFLVTVTSFFRDVEVFAKLEKEILPALFDKKASNDALRIWSVGCATGEEAYSLAILLFEEAARRETPPRVQVFASDLHKHSLEKAREGFYPGEIETEIRAERMKRFFHTENSGFRINKEIRDLVIFAPHNLLGDPPFSRIDLICCRNLLIYLQRGVQRDVIELFHYALNPGGILLLGSAETLDAADLFRTEDKKLCFYSKRNVPLPEPRLPVFPLNNKWIPGEEGRKLQETAEPIAYGALHQRMVERYAPPSVLISADNKILHLSEHAGRYLVHPGGELTASVFRLVREELRVWLQITLQESREKRQALDSKPLPVQFNGHPRLVVMHVRPAFEPQEEGFALVIFEEREPQMPSERAGPSDSEYNSLRVSELEEELGALHKRLQASIEEYESSREEMKASNEEMQSTNEELRSTLEELETSKEELQSINEELQTVNQENRHKVEELALLTGDLQNLLTATDIATLFLDRGLRILRFTPKVSELFNIRATDRGRPLSDLTHRLGYSDLHGDAERVLASLLPFEQEIQDETGRWYLMRVLPYRSPEDRIDGIVITFIDISSRKKAQAALEESESQLRALVNATSDVAYRMSADWTEMRQLRGGGFLADTQAPSRNWLEQYIPSMDQTRMMQAIREAIESKRAFELEHRVHRADGSIGWTFSRAIPILDLNGEVKEWFGIASDVTESRQAEAALRESETRLYSALHAASMATFIWHIQEDRGEPDEKMLALFNQPQNEKFTPTTAISVVHPDDQSPYAHAIAKAIDPHGSGALREDVRVMLPDGSRRWLAITAQVHFQGQPRRAAYMAGAVLDITDRKTAEESLRSSEERFRLFVENVREYALVQTDTDGKITSWNPGAERLFGYQDDEVMGKSFAELMNGVPSEDNLSIDNEPISSSKRLEDAQWLTRKDGSRFWARWISEPVYDDTGRLRGAAKIMRDETEREVAQQAIRSSLNEKEELLREVHHRVKNNLQVITSLLNLQARRIKEPATLAAFEEAKHRVQSIASIHEVLYRSESLATINLVEYAHRIVPDLVKFYGLTEHVAVEIVGEEPSVELERAVPFGLVLNELVSNACKHAFAPGGTGILRVQFEQTAGEIELTVADNGPGIPPELDPQRTTSLGLHLVRNLTRQLRGTIDIRSDSGTTVRIRFPDPETLRKRWKDVDS